MVLVYLENVLTILPSHYICILHSRYRVFQIVTNILDCFEGFALLFRASYQECNFYIS